MVKDRHEWEMEQMFGKKERDKFVCSTCYRLLTIRDMKIRNGLEVCTKCLGKYSRIKPVE